ncbi:MAG: hypothetical protein JWO05_1355 [Gemmatimonadetes bacterium]|nr:hypothetical protein [Gemmatimonadota bacterium]
MNTRFLRRLILTLGVTGGIVHVPLAHAQSRSEREFDQQRWLDDCRHNSWNDQERVCEVRAYGLHASKSLDIKPGPNGGVRVHGWDRDSVAIFALVQAQAESESDANALIKDVAVKIADGKIDTDGPRTRRRQNWSVSFEIMVPRSQDIRAEAENGGISVREVHGLINVETVNGGLDLYHVGGDVKATTVNGGLTVALDGKKWDGKGLSAETTNGGVRVTFPDGYAAHLRAGTTNGGFSVDFPVTIQGRFGKTLETDLNGGGPSIRIETTNGGISLRRE